MRRARILTANAIAQEEWVDVPVGHDQEASTDIAVDVELDASLGHNFIIFLTRSITLSRSHNLTSGRRIKILFQQDQNGGHTVTPGPGWSFGGQLSDFHVDSSADAATIVDAIQTESDLEAPEILCYATTGQILHGSTHLPTGSDPVFTQTDAYTLVGDSTARGFDVGAVTLTQLANVVATMLRDMNNNKIPKVTV